jgi:hypothetical protein
MRGRRECCGLCRLLRCRRRRWRRRLWGRRLVVQTDLLHCEDVVRHLVDIFFV